MIVVVIMKAIVSWFVLAFIGSNMIGMVVRGFFTRPEMERLAHDGHDFTKQKVAKYHRKNRITTSTSVILLLVFFYLLLRYLHPGFAVAAAMLMASRIPDLVWEIRNWQEFDSARHLSWNMWKYLPKREIDVVTILLLWGALPVLFWAFYSV